MRPVVELVDLPLPNQPVARKRLTARLLLLAKMPSSLLPPATDDCSRRHLKRPRIRSIRLELVKRSSSSLFGSVVGAVELCNKPVVVPDPTVASPPAAGLSSSLPLSSGSIFAVTPSSSSRSVRATVFVGFLFVESALAFRAGNSGRVIGVDDRFTDPFGPLLPIDVLREFAASNGDA